MRHYLAVIAARSRGECWSVGFTVKNGNGGDAIKAAKELMEKEFGDMADCYFISRIERIE